ncbi:hypothetical protein BJV74DRAFT_505038 [Russula compacta]|nr:hypothetical protein BJV74DRAFT_505038 [Russula compacta]
MISHPEHPTVPLACFERGTGDNRCSSTMTHPKLLSNPPPSPLPFTSEAGCGIKGEPVPTKTETSFFLGVRHRKAPWNLRGTYTLGKRTSHGTGTGHLWWYGGFTTNLYTMGLLAMPGTTDMGSAPSTTLGSLAPVHTYIQVAWGKINDGGLVVWIVKC